MKKKTSTTNQGKGTIAVTLVNPNATGIDVGDTLHAVVVPNDRDEHPVRTFGAMTCGLEEIVKWLEQCRIDTIAMESTGVYWKSLFTILIQHGFEAYLVNAKRTRNVSGRKTDQSDAQWIPFIGIKNSINISLSFSW